MTLAKSRKETVSSGMFKKTKALLLWEHSADGFQFDGVLSAQLGNITV